MCWPQSVALRRALRDVRISIRSWPTGGLTAKRAMPKKMETQLSEAQWCVLLCRATEASSETRTFDFEVGLSTFGRSLFL